MKNDAIQFLWIGTKLTVIEQISLQSFLDLGYCVDLFTYDYIEGLPNGVRVMNAGDVLAQEEVFTYGIGFGKGSAAAFANLFLSVSTQNQPVIGR